MAFIPESFKKRKVRSPNQIESITIRNLIAENLPSISDELDRLLSGINLTEHFDYIRFMTSKEDPPHWYYNLMKGERPNLQNVKAIGTMIEYLFVCTIHKIIIQEHFPNSDILIVPNPSRGIDLPSLNIDIKAPGKRLDKGPGTSTRAHSPFERLFGLDYHCVILHTNLKTEEIGPLRILRAVFLRPHQLGDSDLSKICSHYREILLPLHEKKFSDLCVFLTFCRRDDKTCNMYLKKLRNLMSSSGNMIIEKLTEIIDLCNVWIIDEDGRNFSLRQPSEKEFLKLKNDPIGGVVTVSFKNELFLQFRQLLEKTTERKLE